MHFREVCKFIWNDLRSVLMFFLATIIIYYPWIPVPDVNCNGMYGTQITDDDGVDPQIASQCLRMYDSVNSDAVIAIVFYILMIIRIGQTLLKIAVLETLIFIVSFVFCDVFNTILDSLYANTKILIIVAIQILFVLMVKQMIGQKRKEFVVKTVEKGQYAKRPIGNKFIISCAGEKFKEKLLEHLKKLSYDSTFSEAAGELPPKVPIA